MLFNAAIYFLCVYLMGFVAAIPIGASQIEVARRSLGGFLASALVVVAGSVSSDFVYGTIALYGLAPFLRRPEVEAIFWLLNAALILVFAIGMLRENNSNGANSDFAMVDAGSSGSIGSPYAIRLNDRRLAYFTGFSLAFTNPMMIAWWLLAVRFLKDLGLAIPFSNTTRIFFLVAGCLGIGSYLSLLGGVIYRRHKSFSPIHVRKITRGFGIAMIFFAGYFVFRSITMLLSPDSARNNLFGVLLVWLRNYHVGSRIYV